jgi:DNA-binding SARP family transcriptional activator
MVNVQFRVLGPVEVSLDDRVIRLGARMVVLLAALLTSPNRVVPVSGLIDWIWGSELPDDPQAALHNVMSRTRRVVGKSAIETYPWGYQLHADPQCLDLLCFSHLRDTADRLLADGRVADAVAFLDQGVALWREPFLGNVASPALRAALTPEFTGRYLEAVETRAALYLRLGRPDVVIRDLPGVVRAHPYRERVTSMLMTALALRGCQTEALSAYEALRLKLRDDLGIEPGAEAQDVFVKILRRNPDLSWTPATQRQ